MIESLSEIHLDSKTRRQINKKYKIQMKRWAPQLVHSSAPSITKGLMAMLTEIWEKKSRESPKPTMKRPKGRQGGYGLYDLRMLRLFGEWVDQIESQGELQYWRVTACCSEVIKAEDANEAARFFREMYPILESDWMSLSVDKEASD